MNDHATVIEQVSRQVGTVHVSASRVDGAGSFGLREAEVVPIASAFKVLLALEVADAFARGDLRPDAQLQVAPERHSPGGAGICNFAHPVAISLADLLYLCLALSDNTASDHLLAQVGLDALHARAGALGLESVRIVGDCRTLLRNAGEDFGYATEADAVAADWAPASDDAELALARTTRASCADLARLGACSPASGPRGRRPAVSFSTSCDARRGPRASPRRSARRSGRARARPGRCSRGGASSASSRGATACGWRSR